MNASQKLLFQSQIIAEHPFVGQITLNPPQNLSHPFNSPVHVYVIRSPQGVALINAGAWECSEDLIHALSLWKIRPQHVHRIIATTPRWELMSGALAFPHAEWCMASPPSQKRAPSMLFQKFRDLVLENAQALNHIESDFTLDLEQWHQAWPYASEDQLQALNSKPWLPLKDRQWINLAGIYFQIILGKGTLDGNLGLYQPEYHWLFSGGLIPDQHEIAWMTHPEDWIHLLEDLLEFDIQLTMPNHRPVQKDLKPVQRARDFFQRLMDNLHQVMSGMKTALTFAQSDLIADQKLDPLLVMTTLGYYSIFERLAEENLIESEGEGLAKTYGTHVERSRAWVEAAPALEGGATCTICSF